MVYILLFFSHIWLYDNNLQETKFIAVGSEPYLSANGRYLVFTSWINNLLLLDDTNGVSDIFVIDLMQL